jgi:hypothetical protein
MFLAASFWFFFVAGFKQVIYQNKIPEQNTRKNLQFSAKIKNNIAKSNPNSIPKAARRS